MLLSYGIPSANLEGMLERNVLAPLAIEWDVATWSQALDFWDLFLPGDLTGWDALEVGGRTGGLSLYLAQRGASVVCSDLTDPSERAAPKHVRSGMACRVRYEAADVRGLPYDDATFQVVTFKSMVGALREAAHQELAFQELHRVLKPGGFLLFAENLRGSRFQMALRRIFRPWGRYWRYVTREEIRRWCEPFRTLDLASAGVLAAWGRTERQRTWLAQLDSRFPFPEAWHYALFGVAQK